ncbi:MAG: YkgJ family cysteine cluster protein [Kofleriaceae bacterium]|nr:YkgJ family cysteine cluster protein [Kofleriaceae bacterium]
MTRAIHHRYVDPLAQIWLDAAARVGLRVVRADDAYASSDGAGTLTIGGDASLDPDDSLAQMIFHELCHSLVQGEDNLRVPDWGLDNETDRDAWREHGCLRLQATLAGRHGLRRFFAPTTDYRGDFWDHLPADPLADRGDPSVQLAIAGLRRVAHPPWAPAVEDALARTAALAAAVAAAPAPGAAHVAVDGLPSLWDQLDPPPPPHPTGLPASPLAAVDDRRCGGCAWRFEGGPGRRAERCRQADNARVDPAWPGCERWEPALDCQTCGACCRAAYHSVEVSRRDPAVRARPDYVVDRGTYLEIRRAGDRCAALGGGEVVTGADGARTTTRYACAIYDDRPRTCRDFTLGSAHCLTARRRVGLSG